MNWIIFALASTLFVGLYNSFLESSKVVIPKGGHNKHMYLAAILVVTGIINCLILVGYSFTRPKDFQSLFNKLQHKYISNKIKIPYLQIVIPAIILTVYMLTNILALNGGGGIAMGIINLNMFVTLALGVMLFGDKVNTKVIIAALIAGLSMSYAAYESSKLN